MRINKYGQIERARETKKFWVAFAVLVAIALIGAVSGWWSSPPAV